MSTQKSIVCLALASGLIASLSGCAQVVSHNTGMGCKNVATIEGGAIGAGAGLIIGKLTGLGGMATGLMTAAGALGGAVAGNQFSSTLGCDDAEAVTKVANANLEAPTGTSVPFNVAGGTGTVAMTGPYQPVQGENGQTMACRTALVSGTKDGKPFSEPHQVCRAPSGWTTLTIPRTGYVSPVAGSGNGPAPVAAAPQPATSYGSQPQAPMGGPPPIAGTGGPAYQAPPVQSLTAEQQTRAGKMSW